MARCSSRKILAAAAAALALAVSLLASAGAATAQTAQTVTVDGASAGRTFDGIGALSAGASSRLLIDYPEPQRSQILDYLFKPGYGASLQILKAEIGGDTNSTDGTEPSHMRTRTDLNCNRGYEWWLMEQAKARNPGIKLYGLEWGAPGWFQADNGATDPTDEFWSQDNINYLLAWLGCAKSHGLSIDFLGGWNEKGYNTTWYEHLKSALDANGYGNIKVVADDSFGWGVAAQMAANPQFNQATDIVGQHYICSATCPSTPQAQALGKPLWASEMGSAPYDTGAQALARDYNRSYIDGQVTADINWSLIWSVYDGMPYAGDGLMQANEPWNGSYTVGKSIWAAAQTTQFTQPGWRYLDQSSGNLDGGGSYVTLRSPATGDYSTVIETIGASAPQQLNLSVTGGLSAGTVHEWSTDLASGDPASWFVHAADITPSNGSYSVTLQPGTVYTLSTTAAAAKGSATSPAASAWQLPYQENFTEYPAGSTPKYFSDLGGAFETAPCQGGRAGMCLRSVISQQPIQWNGWANYPLTVVGDPVSWQDYKVRVDALLEQPGSVQLVGRAEAPMPGVTGYHFQVSDTGSWSLYSQNAGGTNTTLASGQAAAIGTGTWHQLELDMRGDQITPVLDGQPLATVQDATYQYGQIALAGTAWNNAEYSNINVTPFPTNGSRLAIKDVRPDPVSMPTPGQPVPVTADVTNPGSLPATGTSVQLKAPAGWTVQQGTAANGATLAPGASLSPSWTVTAPPGTQPGSYQLTVAVTYSSGGVPWTITQQDPVYVSIIPQSAMTATADSYQAHYASWCCEPQFAIDGDPGTLWHSQFTPYQAPPHEITIDLGGSFDVSGISYLPRQDGNPNGIITSYQVLVSKDGTTFTPAASGNWAADPTLKNVGFPSVAGVRYVRLVGLQGQNGFISAAEINVFGKPSQ